MVARILVRTMEKEFISRDDQEENWKQSGFLGLFEQSFLYRSITDGIQRSQVPVFRAGILALFIEAQNPALGN